MTCYQPLLPIYQEKAQLSFRAIPIFSLSSAGRAAIRNKVIMDR